jgi:hypothetical protein
VSASFSRLTSASLTISKALIIKATRLSSSRSLSGAGLLVNRRAVLIVWNSYLVDGTGIFAGSIVVVAIFDLLGHRSAISQGLGNSGCRAVLLLDRFWLVNSFTSRWVGKWKRNWSASRECRLVFVPCRKSLTFVG